MPETAALHEALGASIALMVAQAGPSSLTDSIGEMRQVVAGLPRGELQKGLSIGGASKAAAALQAQIHAAYD